MKNNYFLNITVLFSGLVQISTIYSSQQAKRQMMQIELPTLESLLAPRTNFPTIFPTAQNQEVQPAQSTVEHVPEPTAPKILTPKPPQAPSANNNEQRTAAQFEEIETPSDAQVSDVRSLLGAPYNHAVVTAASQSHNIGTFNPKRGTIPAWNYEPYISYIKRVIDAGCAQAVAQSPKETEPSFFQHLERAQLDAIEQLKDIIKHQTIAKEGQLTHSSDELMALLASIAINTQTTWTQQRTRLSDAIAMTDQLFTLVSNVSSAQGSLSQKNTTEFLAQIRKIEKNELSMLEKLRAQGKCTITKAIALLKSLYKELESEQIARIQAIRTVREEIHHAGNHETPLSPRASLSNEFHLTTPQQRALE